MNVILFGATGMIGSGVLIECLDDTRVESVLALGRRPCGTDHPKLKERILTDFFDYSEVEDELVGYSACFFCLGVSSAGLKEDTYRTLTYDLTLAAAGTLARLNPGLVFCYVSGEGTDSTEEGRMMWARVKGKTENDLLRMEMPAYMFRPGFVQPMKGVRSRTRLYQFLYTMAGPLFPILRRLFPRHVTTSENLGKAMIRVAYEGFAGTVLENPQINALAEEA